MSTRVFVSNEGPFSYNVAEKYGEVVFLTNREFSPNRASRQNVQNVVEIQQGMSGYIPGIDYLLPSGDPLAIGVMFAVAKREVAKSHNILKWDKQSNSYNLIQLYF